MQNSLVLRPSFASLPAFALSACGCIFAVACGGSDTTTHNPEHGDAGPAMPVETDSGMSTSDDSSVTTPPGDDSGVPANGDSGTPGTTPGSDAAVPGPNGGYPAGWLYTDGNKIMVSTGSTGTQWMGRGVNMDDIFMCGANNNLQSTDPETQQKTEIDGMLSGWKPNFVRYSLGLSSYKTVSWFTNPAQYQMPVTDVVNYLGSHAGVYVLLTLRSDASMMVGASGDKGATWIPSSSMTTPDKTMFPTGTDPLFVALVDTFAHASFVIFALANEPGGNDQPDDVISSAMDHALGVIRAEEDKLGVPHHLVSIQGNGYTSDLKLYTVTPSPITHDNVVYELHYYPGLGGETPDNYKYSTTLPMIVGEYGDFTSGVPQSGFYADMEAKMIPNLRVGLRSLQRLRARPAQRDERSDDAHPGPPGARACRRTCWRTRNRQPSGPG